MSQKEDTYYQAMLARDHRFDGKFFVGVKTTGIYCRPICPAKPKRENVEFFNNHLAAEKAGYRPCLRCRPESAPQSPAWIGTSAVVQRAVKVLRAQGGIEFDENKFADLFGVSARHLRRLFIEEIGKTPKQLSFENRLNLSRQLITETPLPITEIAFASGFSSIRRFNDAFKERFKKTPSEIRRFKTAKGSGLQVLLPYRPPFDFEGLMQSYFNHRVGDLEWFANGKMHRVIAMGGQVGLTTLKSTGIRKQTLVEFSKALIEKRISLEPTQDVEGFLKSLQKIRGIGPWTANYIALKALRSTDTFPGSDLILARALDVHPSAVIDKMSPWRGYVAALLWRTYAPSLKKNKTKAPPTRTTKKRGQQ